MRRRRDPIDRAGTDPAKLADAIGIGERKRPRAGARGLLALGDTGSVGNDAGFPGSGF